MASNRIKGITIEIGGDTKKLDKALSGTNKQLNDTQKNLKDVERLLKMDPGNTELLAQKQRLLSDAVAGTSQKLNTLREAAKTADDALARGKGYEEKYRPLKEELDSTSAALAELRDAQSRMEADLASGKISAEAYEAYQAEVEETEQKLNDLKAAQKSLEAEFAGAKLNQDQYDALQREIIETELALKDAEDAMEDFTSASSKFSSAVSGISSKAGSFANATKGISTAAAGLISAATATVPATEELRTSLSILDNNAEEAGLSVDYVRKMFGNLTAVTNDTGSSVEAISNLLQSGLGYSNLQRALENLTGAYLRFPDTMKVESLADSLQETLATGQAVGQYAELLERLGVNVEAFNNVLSIMPDELAAQNFALDTLAKEGLAETYQSWGQNNQALLDSRQATMDMQLALADLAVTLTPVITAITEFASALLAKFNELPAGTQSAVGGIVAAFAALSPVMSAISGLTGIIGKIPGLVSSIGGAFSGALPALASFFTGPAGIIALAIAAVGGLVALYETNEDFRNALESFDEWLTGVFSRDWTESFGAMGHVVNAFFTSVENIYNNGIKQILGGIVDLVAGVFTGDWKRAWEGVVSIFEGVFSTLISVVKYPINGVIGAINFLIEAVTSAINRVVGLVNSLSFQVPDWVPGIGGEDFGFNLPTVTAPTIPYLAQGTVTRPNSPYLAVVGDNPTEPEIISPYSTIKRAAAEGLAEMGYSLGGGGTVDVTLLIDGAVLARKAVPYFNREYTRRGNGLVR